jgi:NAD(P)-dependent dehydrogenase (short-subunit alcohol dehydrogenase family)
MASSDMGIDFTAITHEKAEGSTLPTSNPPPYTPFNVVVTGAGKGLGRAISLAYAQSGVTGICISSRTQSDLDSLEQEMLAVAPNLDIFSRICDTSDPSAVSALSIACAEHFEDQIDVVIANAGIISKYLNDDSETDRQLPKGIIEDDDFLRVTSINYLGSYYTAKYFTPLLLKRKAPANSSSDADLVRAFVVITSLAGHVPQSAATPVAYNVSKLANNRMVECMANDHGKEGLLAYAVHPGEVVTPQTLRHSVKKGDMWDTMLQTDVGLCGGFLTWLTKSRRDWLSGRYVSVHWDVDELEKKRDEIVEGDKLKFRMVT